MPVEYVDDDYDIRETPESLWKTRVFPRIKEHRRLLHAISRLYRKLLLRAGWWFGMPEEMHRNHAVLRVSEQIESIVDLHHRVLLHFETWLQNFLEDHVLAQYTLLDDPVGQTDDDSLLYYPVPDGEEPFRIDRKELAGFERESGNMLRRISDMYQESQTFLTDMYRQMQKAQRMWMQQLHAPLVLLPPAEQIYLQSPEYYPVGNITDLINAGVEVEQRMKTRRDPNFRYVFYVRSPHGLRQLLKRMQQDKQAQDESRAFEARHRGALSVAAATAGVKRDRDNVDTPPRFRPRAMLGDWGGVSDDD